MPELFQSATPHTAFLGHPSIASGLDIQLAVLSEQFDIDKVSNLLLWFFEEILFQLGQLPPGSAHQVMDGSFGRSHGLKDRICWNAAIHHPGPVGFAILILNFFLIKSSRVVLSLVLPGITS